MSPLAEMDSKLGPRLCCWVLEGSKGREGEM